MIDNLLVRVGKWAGQSENFLTEAFAHLLRNLLENEKETAVSLIRHLTNGIVSMSSECADKILIETQVCTASGFPDLQIQTPRHRIFIEIKDEAIPGDTQISRYRKELLLSPSDIQTGIILLTRYIVKPASSAESPDHLMRWHQIAEFLEKSKPQIKNVVSQYLAESFLGFLRVKNMAIVAVGYELTAGIHALQNLLAMIAAALSSCKIPIYQRIAAWEYQGYYVDPSATPKHFFGIYYEEPTKLHFEGYLNLKAKNYQAIRNQLLTNGPVDSEGCWRIELDLASEAVHFLSLGKASQMICIEDFVRSTWETFQAAKKQESVSITG